MNRIYFDHNATTPIKHAVSDSMLSFFSAVDAKNRANFGNPSSIHGEGRRAKVLLDEAREQIASALGIDDENELVFTGSGTESINSALKGFFFHRFTSKQHVHFISSGVEHEATLEALQFLRSMGAQISFLPLSRSGALSLADLRARLQAIRALPGPQAILVSIMAANNETGVVYPIQGIGELCRQFGAVFHVDAIQWLGKSSQQLELRDAPIDMASFSAHKIGGPKGVGALFIRRGLKLVSLLSGGAQERKRRAGTQNVAGIVGFGKAASVLCPEETAHVQLLRDHFELRVRQQIGGVEIVGSAEPRLVNTSNLLFEGVRGDSLLMSLDLEGIAVSTGSACSSGTVNPSHVLLAMGYSPAAAVSGLRFSFGPSNTLAEVDYCLGVLPEIVARIRGLEGSRQTPCESPTKSIHSEAP